LKSVQIVDAKPDEQSAISNTYFIVADFLAAGSISMAVSQVIKLNPVHTFTKPTYRQATVVTFMMPTPLIDWT
jgi:energy-converting hydrogenase Eha subunit A